jgi:hypothetical protein
MTTLVISLDAQEEAELNELSNQAGVPLEEMAAQLLRHSLHRAKNAPLSEPREEGIVDVPAKTLADIFAGRVGVVNRHQVDYLIPSHQSEEEKRWNKVCCHWVLEAEAGVS